MSATPVMSEKIPGDLFKATVTELLSLLGFVAHIHHGS